MSSLKMDSLNHGSCIADAGRDRRYHGSRGRPAIVTKICPDALLHEHMHKAGVSVAPSQSRLPAQRRSASPARRGLPPAPPVRRSSWPGPSTPSPPPRPGAAAQQRPAFAGDMHVHAFTDVTALMPQAQIQSDMLPDLLLISTSSSIRAVAGAAKPVRVLSSPTCSHSDMAMRASSVEIGAIARDLQVEQQQRRLYFAGATWDTDCGCNMPMCRLTACHLSRGSPATFEWT